MSEKQTKIEELETKQLALIEARKTAKGLEKNRLTRMLNDVIDAKMSIMTGRTIKRKNW